MNPPPTADHLEESVEVTISTRGAKVSQRLEDVTREKIGKLDRFLDGLDQADVHFFEEKNPRIADKEVCEVTLLGHGHHVRAKVAAPDTFTAVDLVVEKLERQLGKLKTKLQKRNHGESKHDKVGHRVGAPVIDEPDDEFRIVKAKSFAIKPVTPVEAVMQMDLLNHDFYFFTNADTGRAAVVYRRNDGDYGLIDEQDTNSV